MVLTTRENVKRFSEILPGSGFNGEWFIEDTRTSIRAYNFYEPMNEAGFYDGLVDFVVIFPKKDHMENFKLQLMGRSSRYYAKKYCLRDYFEDEIVNAVEDVAQEVKNG